MDAHPKPLNKDTLLSRIGLSRDQVRKLLNTEQHEENAKRTREYDEFIAFVKAHALRGVFTLSVPYELRELADYDEVRLALNVGAKRFFESSICSMSLSQYDALGEGLSEDLYQVFSRVKNKFVADFIEAETMIRPSSSQLSVITSEQDARVIARAGSGKTWLLIAKALYLIKLYHVKPNDILLLAFNKKAALEMDARLKKYLGTDEVFSARTFHSLAYQIVKPDADLINSDRDPDKDKVGQVVQSILDDLWSPAFLEEVYHFFRTEIEDPEANPQDLQGEDYYDYRRNLLHVSLRGDVVKSNGEKIIADFLFEHGIDFFYEPAFRFSDGGVYRPDFFIWTGEVSNRRAFVWEHWAFDPELAGSTRSSKWSSVELRRYAADISRKRRYWRSRSKPLLETHAQMLSHGRGVFEGTVKGLLEARGILCRKLPIQTLLDQVSRNARSRLASLLTQFIRRVLACYDSTHEVSAAIDSYRSEDPREHFFLSLGSKVLKSYVKLLKEKHLVDFPLLFSEAKEELRMRKKIPMLHSIGGRMIDINELKWILVDEAQDLTPQYKSLLDSIKQLCPGLKCTFVGDDWQAINQFTGADVTIFQSLHQQYEGLSSHVLQTNFRCAAQIVEAGNSLMAADPERKALPFVKAQGRIEVLELDKVWIEFRQDVMHQSRVDSDRRFLWGKTLRDQRKADPGNLKARLTKAIYQVCAPLISTNTTVAFLFRSNRFNGSTVNAIFDKVLHCFRDSGTSHLDIESLSRRLYLQTAHRVKGLEFDVVGIVSPHIGSFPLVHSDLLLFRFLGDSYHRAVEDERRLFYVALTRAKERLIFLTEGYKSDESPFIEPIRKFISVD